LSYSTNLNGIGQSFIAKEPYLQDASFLLTNSPDTRVWWNDAHIQIIHGLPVGIGADGQNAIYTSPRIDFASLPQTGTVFGSLPVYELAFSQTGLHAPVRITVGDVYTLTLSNFGTVGDSFYADNQPSFFSDGIKVIHLSSETSWRSTTIEDLAFRLIMIPEPGCLLQAVVILMGVVATMRIRI